MGEPARFLNFDFWFLNCALRAFWVIEFWIIEHEYFFWTRIIFEHELFLNTNNTNNTNFFDWKYCEAIKIRVIRVIRVQKKFFRVLYFLRVQKKSCYSCSIIQFFVFKNQADMQLIMQKLLAMAVSTVMTKLMIVFKVSFFIALIFKCLLFSLFLLFSFFLQFPFRSLWKRQNDQMTKWPNDHISRFLALLLAEVLKIIETIGTIFSLFGYLHFL